MIVVPNHGPPEAPRVPHEPESGGTALVRFGDVLAAVQLRRDPDAAAEATPHVADVFNAHGFFADGATPTLSAALPIEDAGARDGRTSPVHTSMTFDAPTSRLPVVEADAATVDSSDAAAARQVADGSVKTAVQTSVVAPRRPVSPPSTPTAGLAGMPVSAVPSALVRRIGASEEAPISPARAATRAPVRPAPGAASDAPQVVVRAGEGVVVVARVDRLGDQARATLRARIAAMLSRNGFSGGVVRLIGGTAAPGG